MRGDDIRGKTGKSPEINSKYQRSIVLHLGHAHVSGSRDEQDQYNGARPFGSKLFFFDSTIRPATLSVQHVNDLHLYLHFKMRIILTKVQQLQNSEKSMQK